MDQAYGNVERLRHARREADEARESGGRRRSNNPGGESAGHHTGRCGRCHSTNLWTDMTAYGCNDCHAFWCFG